MVSAAFLNPDGSKALVAFNDTTTSKTFQVEWGGQSFSYTLAGYSGATFTWAGTQSGSYTINPANQVQASSFDVVSGLMTESSADTSGGYNLGYADNSDYAVYRNVNFTAGLTNVNARVAWFGGGSLEFRLGSPTGASIGSLPIPDTGGWQTWQTVSGPASSVSGLYDLYVVFKGGGSIGNLNWFQFEGASLPEPPGPATQLIWTTQPGSATNGLPFVQQPVLVTADQHGTPSSNGLPVALDVIVTQTAGTGPLTGTTNFNIGTGGFNGMIQFTDLQIDSVGSDKELTASTPALTNVPGGNLLLNGDFNSPNTGDPADNWATWTTGGPAWANHENNPSITYDGSYYMVVGGYEDAGGGCHQTVPATAGVTYELSVLSGADTWWLPYGEMRLYFLNGGGGQVGYSARPTVDPAAYGGQEDIPHPWEPYTLTAVAPPGTAQVKAEFISGETGSVWYENAVLSEVAIAPVLASATTLPFPVHAYIPPTSQTNYIAGISDNGSGVYTLQFVGTMGVQYYVETTSSVVPPVVWEAMVGSTNTVTHTNGLWIHVVTNSNGQQFFRAAAVTP